MQLSFQRWWHGSTIDTFRRPLMKLPPRSSAVLFSLLFLLGGAFISTRLLDSNVLFSCWVASSFASASLGSSLGWKVCQWIYPSLSVLRVLSFCYGQLWTIPPNPFRRN
ncbi:hypothetical protein LINGRAHAP2_LOCUS29358 [Linum grandiflorum]